MLFHARSCKGKDCVPLSVFELHCGSAYKKPAEYCFFKEYDLSIKDVIMLVQVRSVCIP